MFRQQCLGKGPRHHARDLCAARHRWQVGRLDATPAVQPDPVPWSVRANSRYCAWVVPGRQQPTGEQEQTDEEPTAAERRAAMTWAQRLKWVFGIVIETCPACGGAVRIVACLEDPDVIEKIPSLGL